MKGGLGRSGLRTTTTSTRTTSWPTGQAAPGGARPPTEPPARNVPERDQLAQTGGAKAALRALALDVRSPATPPKRTKAGEAASLGARLLGLTKTDGFRKAATVAALGLSLVGAARPAMAQTVMAQPAGDLQRAEVATRAATEGPASPWVLTPASGGRGGSSSTMSPQAALIEARLLANRGARDTVPRLDPATLARNEVRPDALRVEIPLRRGVGVGQPNGEEDVRAVQQRLIDLGFRLDVDGDMGPSSQRALRTFTALVEGKEIARHATPRITPGSRLHQALERGDLPRWMEMPRSGVGFRNIDADHHDYGWSVLADVIHGAGQRYHDAYLCEQPNASPILTNDASLRLGGNTPDHASHETGLDLDVRLPNRRALGAPTRVGSSSYDQDAARAQVKAFIAEPGVERVLIGDAALVRELRRSGDPNAHKVEDGGADHRDHIHVDVTFPDFALG